MAATIGGWSVLVRTEELPLTDLAVVRDLGVRPVLLRPPDGAAVVPGRTSCDATVVRSSLDRHRRDRRDRRPHGHRRETGHGPAGREPARADRSADPVRHLVGSFAVCSAAAARSAQPPHRARRSVGAARAQLQWLSLGGVVPGDGTVRVGHPGGGAPGRLIFAAGCRDRRSRSRWRWCVTSCSTSSSRSTGRSCSGCSARSSSASTSASSSRWAASRRRRGSAWPSSRSSRSWQRADAASCRPASTAGCSGTAVTHTPSSPASGVTSPRRASRRRRCSAWPTRCVTRSDFHTSPSTGR